MELYKNKNVDTTQTTTHIGLCAGYGGIELGLQRVIPNLRSVALCEIEAFACANLVAKMEAGLLDAAPIWTDLKTFPWAEFRDRVDILTGGYPCQPFSAAGKRAGQDDPRHLWPYIADGIIQMRPRICFFENVEGHISLGLSDVIEDLAGMGYRTTWGIFSASEVGASHQRKRVFILAYRDCERGQLSNQWRQSTEQMPISNGAEGRDAECLANSDNQHGYGEERGGSPETDRISSEHWQEEHSRRELGRADATPAWPSRPGELADAYEPRLLPSGSSLSRGATGATCQHGAAWPSRPGEPQHGWEPPRVVANSQGERTARGLAEGGRTKGKNASSRGHSNGGPSQSQSAGAENAMGNAEVMQRNGCDDNARVREQRESFPESGDASGEGMGDTESQRPAAQRAEHEGLSGQLCAASAGDEAMGDTKKHDRGNESEWSPAFGLEQSSGGQTQPPLGRDADGAAGGMDYAELCVSCDNRTDELRLLGNGVVPATAEKAFRVLLEELCKNNALHPR
jgi:site-specific DNA-cytosine methylase